MITALHKLPARNEATGLVNVVVDSPKGSRNKYKFNTELQIWELTKLLPLGASFPFDFGFIPSTEGEDGDPIDVLVFNEEPAFVGCVLPCRLIGILEAEQTEDDETIRNDRLIAVIETEYNPPPFRSLEELGDSRLREIEHFFVSYNEMEGREFRVLARRGPKQAEKLLEAAQIS